MNAQRIDTYEENGCYFLGKLVIVNYMLDAMEDNRWGRFGAQVTFDYLDKAKELVKSKFGEPRRVLLAIPEYVVEVE